jgi:hypothetical protein
MVGSRSSETGKDDETLSEHPEQVRGSSRISFVSSEGKGFNTAVGER